jgi:hypothetical protein
MVYRLAGTFTFALVFDIHVAAHLRRMNQPDAQRRILSILWMSPIYAVTSWFSSFIPRVWSVGNYKGRL